MAEPRLHIDELHLALPAAPGLDAAGVARAVAEHLAAGPLRPSADFGELRISIEGPATPERIARAIGEAIR